MNDTTGADSATRITAERAAALKATGINFIARYYSQDFGKALCRGEAAALSASKIFIVSVYEDNPTYDNYFTAERGQLDAGRAVGQAKAAGQPEGTAIYFAIDYDCQRASYPAIFAYAAAFQRQIKRSGYVEGAYGSGAILAQLLGRGLIALSWLAQSTGWAGYAPFLASGQWSIHQCLPSVVRGVSVDPDIASGRAGGWMALMTTNAVYMRNA